MDVPSAFGPNPGKDTGLKSVVSLADAPPKESLPIKRNSSGNSECWYLRIDGMDFGPATRTQLEQFLRPPRLCSVMQVMCTTKPGVWHAIARHETLDNVLQRLGIEAVPTPELTQRKPNHPVSSNTLTIIGKIREFRKDAFELIMMYQAEISVVFVVLAINVMIHIASADPTEREREIINRYESTWQSIRQFSDERKSSEEWRSFAESAIRELEPLLKELRRTANARRSARRNLLHGGQDHLLTILNSGEPPSQESTDVRLFERRLQLAKEALRVADGISR